MTSKMIPEGREDAARLIRKYLAAYPTADDAQIVVFLEREGTRASPSLIQQVRWELGQNPVATDASDDRPFHPG